MHDSWPNCLEARSVNFEVEAYKLTTLDPSCHLSLSGVGIDRGIGFCHAEHMQERALRLRTLTWPDKSAHGSQTL